MESQSVTLFNKDGLSRKGKPRVVNRPDLDKYGEENAEPGDNAKYLKFALASWDLPPIDLYNQEQVVDRIDKYFKYCYDNDRKPNLIGMCNWLGMSRDMLQRIKRGDFHSVPLSGLIQRAVSIMEEQWADYMLNGKVNPASGIFLAKNLYQYRDVIDIAPVVENPMGDRISPKELASKYGDLPDE